MHEASRLIGYQQAFSTAGTAYPNHLYRIDLQIDLENARVPSLTKTASESGVHPRANEMQPLNLYFVTLVS